MRGKQTDCRRVASARVPCRTVKLDVYNVDNALCNKGKEIEKGYSQLRPYSASRTIGNNFRNESLVIFKLVLKGEYDCYCFFYSS
jgi:hypothetical protein